MTNLHRLGEETLGKLFMEQRSRSYGLWMICKVLNNLIMFIQIKNHLNRLAAEKSYQLYAQFTDFNYIIFDCFFSLCERCHFLKGRPKKTLRKSFNFSPNEVILKGISFGMYQLLRAVRFTNL